MLSYVFSLLNLYTANAAGIELGNPWLSHVVPEMTLLGGIVLGKYSFSLMLAHSFVLLSGSTLIFLKLKSAGVAEGWNLLLCMLAGLPVCALAAFVAEKCIGGITVWLNNRLFVKKRRAQTDENQ